MDPGRMGRSVAVAAAALVVLASLAHAELAKWNQERVTKYAEELKDAAANLHQAFRPVDVSGVTVKDQYYRARESVSMIHDSAAGLAAALKAGEGMEVTLPRFQRLQALRREAEKEARDAELSNDLIGKIVAVGDALFKLRPYYQEEPMPGESKAP